MAEGNRPYVSMKCAMISVIGSTPVVVEVAPLCNGMRERSTEYLSSTLSDSCFLFHLDLGTAAEAYRFPRLQQEKFGGEAFSWTTGIGTLLSLR